MIDSEDCRMVFVTAPDIDSGRRIARAVVAAKLAACVNILSGVESHYHWEGRMECGQEVLLLVKTTSARMEELERRVIEEHPYDTPEFVVSEIAGGNKRYMDWLRASVAK